MDFPLHLIGQNCISYPPSSPPSRPVIDQWVAMIHLTQSWFISWANQGSSLLKISNAPAVNCTNHIVNREGEGVAVRYVMDSACHAQSLRLATSYSQGRDLDPTWRKTDLLDMYTDSFGEFWKFFSLLSYHLLWVLPTPFSLVVELVFYPLELDLWIYVCWGRGDTMITPLRVSSRANCGLFGETAYWVSEKRGNSHSKGRPACWRPQARK